jgi:hypothetical protein
MSVLTPKRLFLCVVAVLTATTAFASHPSPRTYARAAWDEQNRVVVLFGGRAGNDAATGVPHASDETWLFLGAAWAQRFPATTPPARSAHTMTYDSRNHRVVMFGGRQEEADPNSDPVFLNDLWAWQNDNWTRLDADLTTRPSERNSAGFAHDPKNDRLIVYGGNELAGRDGNNVTIIFDTWEFAGGTWTKTATDSPKVNRPLLAYNPVTEKVYMVGASNTDGKPVMFRYDDGTWTDLTPSAMPTCVVEGHFLWAPDRGRFVFIGGICAAATPPSQELFEYDADANKWNKITIPAAARGIGQASVYDTFRNRIVFFGGNVFGGASLTAFTTTLNGLKWQTTESFHDPGARALHIFEADPSRNLIWMFGGLLEGGGNNYRQDFWGYRDRQWFVGPDYLDAPVDCQNPVGGRDPDRDRLVIACLGSGIWEFDGTEWDSLDNLEGPDERRFSAMVYDKRLKKMVLFGGFFNNNYFNDTWTWDGTKWTEIELDDDEAPEHRSSMSMWYDPLLERTVLYSGIGRPNLNEQVTRFQDMWTFDGTRWTKLEVTNTPGIRLRPQIAVHPVTGKLTLVGGLRAESVDEDSIRQFFDNDMWEWDGSTKTWTQIPTTRRPPVRQNGGMAWDPVTGELVLFGGYAKGFYLSDLWIWNGTEWAPRLEPLSGRRRSVR